MFKRIAPQRAQHRLGFIVQIGSRHTIQYLDKNFVAEVETDMTDAIVPIFIDTLAANKAGNVPSGLTQEQAELITSRIKEGMDCLGVKYEICKLRS